MSLLARDPLGGPGADSAAPPVPRGDHVPDRADSHDSAVDRSGLQVLSEDECLALLGSVPIGRIAYSERALPVVVPVNFTIDGTCVVVRTHRRSRLATVVPGNVVAFEVDDIDRQTRSGWSVVLTGSFELVEDPAEVARLDRLDLHSWAPSAHDRYLRLCAEIVTGRRIPRAEAQSDREPGSPDDLSRRVAPAS